MVAWRPWLQAADALDEAAEAEDFQSVGMRCRESLRQLADALAQANMVPAGQVPPKRGDFIHWSELIAAAVAGGSSAADLRSHLKATSRSAWQVVNWLTHYSKASHFDARLALSATEAVLVASGTAVLRHDPCDLGRCPRCRSYSMTSGDGDDGRALVSCETCGWKSVAPASGT